MSLFESTVVFIYVMLHVSCVSSNIFTVPDEVAAVEEFVKIAQFGKCNFENCTLCELHILRSAHSASNSYEVNNFYYNTIPAFVEHGNKDNYDGRQKKAREKRNTGNMAAAAKQPMTRLWRLTILLFRNIFSTEPIDGDPPLNPPKAAQSTAMMLRKGLDILKGKEKTVQNPKF